MKEKKTLSEKTNNSPSPVWLSWLEYHPIDQKVIDSIPSQGTYSGCWFKPQSVRVQEGNQSMFLAHTDVSFFFCLPHPSKSNEKKCPQVSIKNFFFKKTNNSTTKQPNSKMGKGLE